MLKRPGRDEDKHVKASRARPVPAAEGGEPVDENTHTCWVRTKDTKIREAENLGYTVAKSEDVVFDHFGTERPSGNIEWGDLTLMKAKREDVEARDAEKKQELAYQERLVKGGEEQAGLLTYPEDGTRRPKGKNRSYFYGK